MGDRSTANKSGNSKREGTEATASLVSSSQKVEESALLLVRLIHGHHAPCMQCIKRGAAENAGNNHMIRKGREGGQKQNEGGGGGVKTDLVSSSPK